MSYQESLERAKELAELANLLMEDQKIAPHPRNFTVWYDYFSGRNEAMRVTLDALLNKGQRFTEACNELIYRKFCAEDPIDIPVQQIAASMTTELGSIRGVVEGAEQGAANYHRTLRSASGEIKETADVDGFKDIVSWLLTETRTMVEHSRDAERKLNESAERISRLTDELDAVKREAMTDPLTGLANRKVFDSMLRHAIVEAMDSGEPLSLLLLDADHFKRFNDRYGHPVGDQVLKLLAVTMQKVIREPRTTARYGGEEFAVVLPETSLKNAVIVAERIRNAVAERAVIQRKTGEKMMPLTVSIGVASLSPGEPARSLIQRADDALYLAKRRGRNTVASESDLQDNRLRPAT